MIQVKAVVPGKLKPEVFSKWARATVQRTIDAADKEFAKTYATWDNKPKFVKKITEKPGQVVGEDYTTDQVYAWLNDGTKGPYKIPKAGPGFLAFPSGYTAKTTPNVLGSKAGGPHGDMVFIHGQVMHPGIKPRNFEGVVKVFVEPWFKYWGDDAMKKAAKESGHAI